VHCIHLVRILCFFKEVKFSAVRECDSKPAGMVVVMYVSGQVVVEKEALPSDMLL